MNLPPNNFFGHTSDTLDEFEVALAEKHLESS